MLMISPGAELSFISNAMGGVERFWRLFICFHGYEHPGELSNLQPKSRGLIESTTRL
jgi:hypothetical protein